MRDAVLKPNLSTREKWIDIARGLGMILVVLGHSNPPEWLRITIGSFHMPLFFFLSGLVLNERKDYLDKKYIIKDFIRLIVPYLVTVAIVGISLVIMWSQGKNGYYDSFSELLLAALFGSGVGREGIKLIGEIWFLLAMFWSRRLIAVVCSLHRLSLQIVTVAYFVMVSILLSYKNVWLPMNIDIAFLAVGFVFAGWLVKKNISLLENDGFLFAMMIIYIAARSSSLFGMADRNYSTLWYVAIPGALAMCCLFCRLSKCFINFAGVNSFFAFIGRHTLLFMCVHSLDWRLPFPKFGQSFVSSFANSNWYWLLSFVHRFAFDLFVVCCVLLIRIVFKKIMQSSSARSNRGSEKQGK